MSEHLTLITIVQKSTDKSQTVNFNVQLVEIWDETGSQIWTLFFIPRTRIKFEQQGVSLWVPEWSITVRTYTRFFVWIPGKVPRTGEGNAMAELCNNKINKAANGCTAE